MIVTNRTQFLADGDPVEELTLDGSRFDRISIRLSDDEMTVRASEVGTDTVVEVEFEKVPNKLFKPVVPSDGARRDVSDDIQDALASIGYAPVDHSVIDI